MARIRCAYINSSFDQTVIFWFEEINYNAHCAQAALYKTITTSNWLKKTFPFEVPNRNEELKLYQNNKIVYGKKLGYGYILFHYTHCGYHDREELKNNAKVLRDAVHKMVKRSQDIIVDDKLFLYNSECVWSCITNLTSCISRLKRETNDYMLNTSSNICNPHFWDRHEKIIEKYFYPYMLSIDLANQFNAPIEQLDPSITRTVELIEYMKNRRAYANTESHNSQSELPNDQNPIAQLNYCINPSPTLGDMILNNNAEFLENENEKIDEEMLLKAFLESDEKLDEISLHSNETMKK
jgi:hypothetical protein